MAKLTINQLIIISENEKRANKFRFGKGKNLITSDSNTVGKSTLVKMILWSFGCKPKFDGEWGKLSLSTAIEFSVDKTQYIILRQENQMSIKEGELEWNVYPRISGDYSSRLGKILEFSPLFKLKKTDNHQTSTPDGYFMAYYLDQQCWHDVWISLDGLNGFDSYKNSLIKAHSGYLTKEFFECQNKELNIQEQKRRDEELLSKYNDAVELVQKECNPTISTSTLDSIEFSHMRSVIQDKLLNLQKSQTLLWDKLAKLYNEKHCLEIQIPILEKNINDSNKDYEFSLTLDQVINCPICHSQLTNDVIQKARLLSDKVSFETQLEDAKRKLAELNLSIEKLQPKYDDVSRKIDEINNDYIIDDEGSGITTMDYLSKIGEKSIFDKLSVNRYHQEQTIESKNLEIKKLGNEKKLIEKQVNKEDINTYFLTMLKEVDELLGLDYNNIKDKVKGPVDYKKIFQGGAADKTRSVLSYYAALHLLIRHQNNEVVGPLIIDTPKQQAQSDDNEANIMNLINNKLANTKQTYQLFLCAKNEDILRDYKDGAQIFDLKKHKGLLEEDMYDECKIEFSKYK